jgi:hypothetical protein
MYVIKSYKSGYSASSKQKYDTELATQTTVCSNYRLNHYSTSETGSVFTRHLTLIPFCSLNLSRPWKTNTWCGKPNTNTIKMLSAVGNSKNKQSFKLITYWYLQSSYKSNRLLWWRMTASNSAVFPLWPSCQFLLQQQSSKISAGKCFTLLFWHYCGPLLHECHHQHSFPVPENSCHQPAGICFSKHFGLIGERAHPLLWLLFAFNNDKRNARFVASCSYDVTEKFIIIFAASP